jgi:hypothetical protein
MSDAKTGLSEEDIKRAEEAFWYTGPEWRKKRDAVRAEHAKRLTEASERDKQPRGSQ